MDEEPQDQQSKPSWMDEAEAALERAGDSLMAAWDETRDARMAALEAAKQAADELGKAIDRGVDAARARWQAADAAGEEE